jgi:hypothetical protein
MSVIVTSTTTLTNKTTKVMMAGVRERALKPTMGRPRRHMREKWETGTGLLENPWTGHIIVHIGHFFWLLRSMIVQWNSNWLLTPTEPSLKTVD